MYRRKAPPSLGGPAACVVASAGFAAAGAAGAAVGWPAAFESAGGAGGAAGCAQALSRAIPSPARPSVFSASRRVNRPPRSIEESPTRSRMVSRLLRIDGHRVRAFLLAVRPGSRTVDLLPTVSWSVASFVLAVGLRGDPLGRPLDRADPAGL